jgi:hypothetical protein
LEWASKIRFVNAMACPLATSTKNNWHVQGVDSPLFVVADKVTLVPGSKQGRLSAKARREGRLDSSRLGELSRHVGPSGAKDTVDDSEDGGDDEDGADEAGVEGSRSVAGRQGVKIERSESGADLTEAERFSGELKTAASGGEVAFLLNLNRDIKPELGESGD